MRYMLLNSFILFLFITISQQLVYGQVGGGKNEVLNDYLGNDRKNNQASNKENSSKKLSGLRDKLYYGGTGMLSFGTITFIDISPQLGYKISEDFSVGIGGIYNYYRERIRFSNNQSIVFQTSIYGVNAFARMFVVENIFAQIQPQAINLEPLDMSTKQRFWLSNLFVGGGYRQRIDERSSVLAILLYNTSHSPNSPYGSPILFQFGFVVGL